MPSAGTHMRCMLANGQLIARHILAILTDSRYQRLLLAVVLVVLLFAGLQPFNFVPGNQVTWLQGRRGVEFHGYGQVQGVWNRDLLQRAAENGGGVTIELSVRCSQERLRTDNLLTVFSGLNREPFSVTQYGSLVMVSGIADGRGKKAFLGASDALHSGIPGLITITSGPQGIVIYVDGVARQRGAGTSLAPDNFEGTLLLGQSPRGGQEWHGDIYGLAVYPKALRADEVAANYDAWKREDWARLQQLAPAALYRFDEGSGTVVHNRAGLEGDLTIPQKFRPLNPVILKSPSKRDFTDLSDVTINIVGFVPLGVLLVFYLAKRGCSIINAIAAAIMAGFTISLLIEILQVLLPSRDSSLLDLINNTVGTAVGAWIGAYFCAQTVLGSQPMLKRQVSSRPAGGET